MVRAFHWQYGDILLAIYLFVFTYYFVLSLKNKYTISIYSFPVNITSLLIQFMVFVVCYRYVVFTLWHCGK